MVHGEVVGLMNGELVMGGILEGDCKDSARVTCQPSTRLTELWFYVLLDTK